MPEIREILDVPGLRDTSGAFKRELIRVADRRGLDPSYLAAVISFESGFDPAKKNAAGSSGTGLIQFMEFTASELGTTTAKLAQMSAVEQLAYVEKFYAHNDPNKRISSLEDTYMAVLAPACIGYPSSAHVACKEGFVWKRPAEGCPKPLKGTYCQNSGLDIDGDGYVSVHEASTKVRQKLQAAGGRTIAVDMDGTDQEPPAPGGAVPLATAGSNAAGVLVPFALGALAGFKLIEFVTDRIIAATPQPKRRR